MHRYLRIYLLACIGQSGRDNPYENALAERMNGILKNEFNLYSSTLSFDETYQLITRSIVAYNSLRPHSSCDYLTPLAAHTKKGILKKRWKNYNSTNPISSTLLKGRARAQLIKKQAPWPVFQKETR